MTMTMTTANRHVHRQPCMDHLTNVNAGTPTLLPNTNPNVTTTTMTMTTANRHVHRQSCTDHLANANTGAPTLLLPLVVPQPCTDHLANTKASAPTLLSLLVVPQPCMDHLANAGASVHHRMCTDYPPTSANNIHDVHAPHCTQRTCPPPNVY
ncbi:unnamed protein product [Cyclocybe aegerita]|uniref:Uncharacterized protein n=1 Tax=Cyclocybe aegerita TaxID=1973307 RepID=A0A8S0Y0X2_CYCAE|nr:unnamed protein product [Cyclocybe aegerita]